MCKEAAVAYSYLTTKVLGVDGFRVSACEILNVQQRFCSLRCRVPSACDGVSCSDAATADFFLCSAQNASFGR